MNLGQFRAQTAHLPDDLELGMIQREEESAYSEVENVRVREIEFRGDGVPKKEWPKIKCLVVSDEF